MIIDNPQGLRLDIFTIKKFTQNGVIADTNILFNLFISKYIDCNENKNYLYKKARISKKEISCLNDVLANLRIPKLIITPHIFSEFINKIRNELKEDCKGINKNSCEEIKNFFEIYVNKNDLINHQKFLDFGNDISLIFATEKQIKDYKYATIISFDGRFLKEFFGNEKNENILAINLGILKYFY